MTTIEHYPVETIERQIVAILERWGMDAGCAATTASVLVWADLRGVDSHGIGMIAPYQRLWKDGSITMQPEFRVVKESPLTALVDAGGGLGHVASVKAMEMAIEKCSTMGLSAVAVRNSHHFGAAGYYAEMAVKKGLIGTAYTAVHRPTVVPTFGAESMFGTNPIAFAAPAARNEPFFLDMATSTTALGKLSVAARAGKSIAPGLALGPDGQPETDPTKAFDARKLTPLGASPELSSHKGYGLAMMVEILCTTLSGATFGATRGPRQPDDRWDVGHFFLCIDPAQFRDEGAFEADMDDMLDALRATPAVDPARPVMVAGDPEVAERRRRIENGVPLPKVLVEDIRRVAREASAEAIL